MCDYTNRPQLVSDLFSGINLIQYPNFTGLKPRISARYCTHSRKSLEIPSCCQLRIPQQLVQQHFQGLWMSEQSSKPFAHKASLILQMELVLRANIYMVQKTCEFIQTCKQTHKRGKKKKCKRGQVLKSDDFAASQLISTKHFE